MPNAENSAQARYELRIAEEFISGLATVYSPRILEQIEKTIDLLEASPELGSTQVRPCLTERYGEGLRKIPLSTFVIVYRFDGATVDVLALVYGPGIA